VLRHLPNALSLARLLSAPVLVVLALVQRERAFAVLLIAALVTDVLDGWLARRFRLQSKTGAALDSAGDVATLAAAAVGIACFHADVWHGHRIAVGLVLGGWVLVCALALLRYRRLSSFHTYASKAAGYALGFFIAALFASGFVPWLFYLAVALSLASTAEELLLLWRLPQWRADVRGLWWVRREAASDFKRG
jgi:CDP-diacylglycerol--glycerol-3-phosphate 3-phosphatidyltransferase